jgi:putative transposase
MGKEGTPMPWKETCAMDQKVQLIGDWLSEEYSVTELSQMYSVSRNTVYKWIGRYASEGVESMEERPRAPRNHPNATPGDIVDRIIKAKLEHQRWGPRKVLAWLEGQQPDKRWPAASTAGEILRKVGLVRARRRKRRTPPYSEPFQSCERPNQVWSADFKGQFRTRDGKQCYPLTVTDNSSRYLLACRGLERPTYKETRPWFEWVFREHGLPEAIRTDNGSPFASVGAGGLSRLSVWFIKLGIKPERIQTGHPEQNGRHEGMHRTMKEETASPPSEDLMEQQRSFDRFKQEYNLHRPHEALGQKPPATVYETSAREYPARVPKVEYDLEMEVRHVRPNGGIKWRGKEVYVSEALVGEPVGLRQQDEHLWEVRFRTHPLGILNELIGKIES